MTEDACESAWKRWQKEHGAVSKREDFEAGWREALGVLPSINCECLVCREVRARYEASRARV